MKILAIDTATDVCSVCILENDDIISEKTLDTINTHSVELMPLIDTILKENNLTLNEIDLFACDKGPGSFTGIRIGIATIKAFCDVTKKPCISISSLDGFAYSDEADETSLICSLVNANHGNVYYGLFGKNNDKIVQLEDFTFNSIQEVLLHLNDLEKNIFFVGNCGTLLNDMIKSGYKFDYKISHIQNISAKYIGVAAFSKFSDNNFENSNTLSPLYIKKSSAEK